MSEITAEDWGRIFAFIWRDVKTGTGEYKAKFEKDPALAVKEIAAQLNINYYDRLFDVAVDPTFSPAELDNIINGQATNFKFFLRISC